MKIMIQKSWPWILLKENRIKAKKRCIQALTGNLIAKSQRGDDDRVGMGYLMVLCGWLYEDPDAVNDFLGEGSNVQSLVQMILQPSQQKILLAGLCAFLLGIIYEFSSKDSPIPRAMLHDIFTTRLGRELFNDKMAKLREHHLIRDFEVLPQGFISDQGGGMPEVYFDKTFVDFLKDNFSRVLRAIDRDPGIEVSVVANGVQKGISRELVDSLKSQLEDRNQALHKAESEVLNLERRLGQEQADHRKTKESATIELHRIKGIIETLQKNHKEDRQSSQEESRRALHDAQTTHQRLMTSLQTETQKARYEIEGAALRERTRNATEVADLKFTIETLKKELEKSNKDHAQDLSMAHEEYVTNTKILESQVERAQEKADEAAARAASVDETEEARANVQTELDDLFMVLGDLEEKRAKDKVCITFAKRDIQANQVIRNGSKDWESQCQMARMEVTTMMGRKTPSFAIYIVVFELLL